MKQEDSGAQKETAHPLAFQYLTGNWETMDVIDEGVFSYPDYDFIDRHWEAKRAPLKPENLNKQLAGTDFSFEFGSRDWSLLKKGKQVATGQTLDYFLTDKKHLIACTLNASSFPACWIDGKWKEVNTYQAFPKIFDGKVYALSSSDEMLHELLQGEQTIYAFSAYFPTAEPLLALEVNTEGWWILYRDIVLEPAAIKYHLIHNGENISQKG